MKILIQFEKGDKFSDVPDELLTAAIEPTVNQLYSPVLAGLTMSNIRRHIEAGRGEEAIEQLDSVLESCFNVPGFSTLTIELPLSAEEEQEEVTIKVPSSTRPGLSHTVSLNEAGIGYRCTCEGYVHKGKCKHVGTYYGER